MNDSEAEVQQTGYKAFECGERVLSLLSAFIPACSVNTEKVRANGDAACITVTELADTLVRDEGLSFRQAHAIASVTSRFVIERGSGLRSGYEAFASAFKREAGRDARLSKADYSYAIAPATFIARRSPLGGPAPSALEYAIAVYENEVRECRGRHLMRVANRRKAAASLDAAFNAQLDG